MAKKNHKQSKINQKIRDYFDGEPFDIGIATVEIKTLSELFVSLGLYDAPDDKELLIKAARKMWSDGDTEIRRFILDFFRANGKIYKSQSFTKPTIEQEEKLSSLIDELGASYDESVRLKEAFADVKSKKITIEKLESKLAHIRFLAKKERIEKRVDGIFNLDDALEFNASFAYKIYDDFFHKILTITTKPFLYEFLKDSDEDLIVHEVEGAKREAAAAKQESIDKFLGSIKEPHLYLDKQEISSALRAMSPHSTTLYPALKKTMLARIISSGMVNNGIEVFDEEVLVFAKESILLPYSNRTHEYELDLHIELSSLLEDIWESGEIDFAQMASDAKREHEEQFIEELAALAFECNATATLLRLDNQTLYARVYDALLEQLPNTLHISSKLERKTIKRFAYSVREEIVKKQRYELLARTIRNFKDLFPVARALRRKLTLHIGPTNSGKTYGAMQKLKNADTGYYLAPLRLLALEGYEELRSSGIEASLITGEEQLLGADASHISSTIEMLDFAVDVDVCVIDEVQMLDDRDRGWAWANAIIGAPAKEVIMTGSPNVKDAIVALAAYLGEPLEIVEFERKNPLILMEEATSESRIEPATAIIAFSRRDVLKLKQNLSKSFDVSVVYGNLSPEVRREEARRFRSGETQVLIATDAIAMGMNLPIKTILFAKSMKFDGVTDRVLLPSEVLQIAGRAGRFGLHEQGFVGALNQDVLRSIKKSFLKHPQDIELPFKVMANLEHIKLVATILQESSLHAILKFFAQNMEFDGPFVAANLDDMVEVSMLIDNYDLDIASKYHLACAPISLKSPYIMAVFDSYLHSLEKKLPISYVMPKLYGDTAYTSDELLRAEDMVKEISLYLWLSYRFEDYFIDHERAYAARGVLNRYIEKSLQQSQLALKCKMCQAPLPLNSPYGICQNCFKRNFVKRVKK